MKTLYVILEVIAVFGAAVVRITLTKLLLYERQLRNRHLEARHNAIALAVRAGNFPVGTAQLLALTGKSNLPASPRSEIANKILASYSSSCRTAIRRRTHGLHPVTPENRASATSYMRGNMARISERY
jgi:hypothetical protein